VMRISAGRQGFFPDEFPSTRPKSAGGDSADGLLHFCNAAWQMSHRIFQVIAISVNRADGRAGGLDGVAVARCDGGGMPSDAIHWGLSVRSKTAAHAEGDKVSM